jgi:hypothetical protein
MFIIVIIRSLGFLSAAFMIVIIKQNVHFNFQPPVMLLFFSQKLFY